MPSQSTTTGKMALPKDEIHLWCCNPSKIVEPIVLARYQQLMTEEEATKQQRYRFEHDQHDALITRALARTVLSQYAERNPEDWRFEKGEKDKPEIVDPPFALRFNLSHTKDLIVCAVAHHHDIGVDVEDISRNSDVLAIADRYFSPTEVDELFSHEDDAVKRSRFFDYWTLKESYIKAWGLGLAIPLDHFSFHIGPRPEENGTSALTHTDIRLSFDARRQDRPQDWLSWLFYPSERHRMALSVRSVDPAIALPTKVKLFHTTPLLSHHPLELPWRI